MSYVENKTDMDKNERDKFNLNIFNLIKNYE
jgi:hypothetical protein